MTIKRVKLGQMAKDRITGFEGYVEATIEYANGCIQYKLISKEIKDGKEEVSIWFDVQRLTTVAKKSKRPGGPFKGEPVFDKP